MPPPPAAAVSKGRRFTVSIVSGLCALAAMGISSTLGNVHGPTVHQKVVAFTGAAVFCVLAIVAVQTAADTLAVVVVARAGRSGASAVRVIASFVGYVIVVIVGLGLIDVPVQHLLIGGALTGVIVGIAAQQALGNVFAGLVLLLARPFVLDERIRIRSGSLGGPGPVIGVVRGQNLAYVTVETDDGLLNVPNSVILAAGVGPAPPDDPTADLAVVTAGPPPMPMLMAGTAGRRRFHAAPRSDLECPR